MLWLILISLIPLFQAAPVSTGTLTVRVLERGTKAPLGGVRVSVSSLWSSPAIDVGGITQADGTAIFAGLKPGVYEVRAGSETHLAFEADPFPGAGDAAIMLPWVAEGQDVLRIFPGVASVRVQPDRRLDLTFELPPAGVIAGRILSPGSASVSAFVSLYEAFGTGTSSYPVRRPPVSMKTGADGSFAFRGLLRGTYLLTVRPGDDDSNRLSEVYYPGVVDLREATPLRVSGAQLDLPAIKLTAVPMVTIAGQIEDDGEGKRELLARDLDISFGDAIHISEIPLRRNGSFSVPSVAGVKGFLYTRKRADGFVLSAVTAVAHVGAKPVDGIRLAPVAPATVSGRFVFERPYERPKSDLDPQLYLTPIGPDAWLRHNLGAGGFRKDDLFQIEGVIGAHLIDARAPTGWVVNGVILDDGRNILDTTFEFEPGKHYANLRVLLSPESATVEGLVQPPRRDPAALDLVVLFPVDDSVRGVQRYSQEVSIKPDGSFRVPTVTPGREYYVTTCQWPCTNPEDMEDRIKRATRIFIDRPGIFTVTLKR